MNKEVVVHMHSEILFSYKKHIWVSSNEVDETEAYYTEWSKPERKHKYSIVTQLNLNKVVWL